MTDSVRIDRWLWAARFYRTRSLGKKALEAGRVQVGEKRAKPARQLSVGDVVSLARGDEQITVVVLKLAEKRGSASVAQTLYEETAASLALRQQRAEERALQHKLHAAPRKKPDRRARRELQELKRQ